MELQGDRVLLLREDFVNLVEPLAIGRANVSEFAHTVARGDTKENGTEVKIKHPVFLQTRVRLGYVKVGPTSKRLPAGVRQTYGYHP